MEAIIDGDNLIANGGSEEAAQGILQKIKAAADGLKLRRYIVNDNFDNLNSLGDLSSDWKPIETGGKVTLGSENGNKYLKLTQTQKGSGLSVEANRMFPEMSGKVYMEARVRSDAPTNFYGSPFIYKNDSSTTIIATAALRDNGSIKVSNKGGNSTSTAEVGKFNIGEWNTIDLILDSSTQKVQAYVNGVLQQQDLPMRNPLTTLGKLRFYSDDNNGSNPLAIGYVDFVRVYQEGTAAINLETLDSKLAEAALYLDNEAYTSESRTALSNFIQTISEEKAGYTTQSQVDAAVASLEQAVSALVEAETEVRAAWDGTDQVSAGQPFSVTYGLRHVKDGIFAQDVVVSYDSNKVEYVSSESLQSNLEVVSELSQDGEVRILAASLGEGNEVHTDGDFLKLNFKAKQAEASSETTVALSNAVISNGAGNETQLTGITHHVRINAVNKTALHASIEKAISTYQSAEEGNRAGQYPVGSKAVLQAAINSAKATEDNTAATQSEVDQAEAALNEALQTFTDSVIIGIPSDVNGDSKVTIGDLAIIVKYYGARAGDENWNEVKFADINGDGAVNIMDLAVVARLILGD
ncbi:cohesin domain-containing protein [Paenibacillus hexagrammi]|uniref:Cohesin domain-containing protein n=1 Tax=Paenibacillus hexagrammi TaxID=2908839 RepID=A0ABY3SE91_9BACL|nr:cohesin domain-containing protein [Paenibacillus sp. YPD9-1]UJF31745.1 cohesin domain-containing protein [Paenibacillus sp. YPD9-1]